MSDKKAALMADLNRETSKIAWKDIQKFFAGGNAIFVAESLDLIEVAAEIAMDNNVQLQQWMDSDQVAAVTDKQAGEWFEKDVTVWAVVVSPWVLVQAVKQQ